MTIHKCIHFVKRYLKIMFIRIFVDIALQGTTILTFTVGAMFFLIKKYVSKLY